MTSRTDTAPRGHDRRRRVLLAASAAWLAGCAGPRIDTRFNALSQGPRVDLVVLHYTALDFDTSLRVLTQQVVSSHYLVDVDPPTIYRLVPEDRRANHAGVSAWAGRVLVNMSSIGIEIVNPGRESTPEGERYAAFAPAQIDAVIALLRDILARWGIPKERVVGHADVAPGRKQDPGPLFPWKQLAQAGVSIWFDEALAAALQPRYALALPGADWFRLRLAQFGYAVPTPGEGAARSGSAAGGESAHRGDGGDSVDNADRVLDARTRDALISFQMRFRPARYDGSPDAETAAILAALTQP